MANRKLMLAALFGGALLFGTHAIALADDVPMPCDPDSNCGPVPVEPPGCDDCAPGPAPDPGTAPGGPIEPDPGVTPPEPDPEPPAPEPDPQGE